MNNCDRCHECSRQHDHEDHRIRDHASDDDHLCGFDRHQGDGRCCPPLHHLCGRRRGPCGGYVGGECGRDTDGTDGASHDGTSHDGTSHDGTAGWRPTRTPGTSTGDLTGRPMTPGDLTRHAPPTVWPGVRKQMYLPYLFLRANPGDTGTRPVVGPFWESPDVYILPGVAPQFAPDVPAQLGQTALAGADNTVYAHIWNLGLATAREVVVEFYWCNPSLGFNPVGAHRIGRTVTWLGARGSGDCHKVVKCPNSWRATYDNGGHECLLIRAWDVAADPLTTPEWDASINRHLGQRNIHVVPAGESGPVTLAVGSLFGHAADVTVTRDAPHTMPWLQLHGGVRGQFPAPAVGTGALTLGRPGQLGEVGDVRVTGDDAAVLFATGDAAPAPGQGHVYRVSASQEGQLIGGYTVVRLG